MKFMKMLSTYITGAMIKKSRKLCNGDTALSLDVERVQCKSRVIHIIIKQLINQIFAGVRISLLPP